MKSIKHRLLSLLLTLVTVLSLLPTAAFAASNTGSGLKITTNQAYWSTRLLANGTPYSYRPPLVDGKLVYCMDSGLGYHYATPSYLNSFTWTSGTGADADAVLQSAVTNSGLSEMDAATVENVKWMMTYLNDCKASNVGQLFMAVQTYVWDHQSYKGEPGGDGDAGGYANADTYDLYLSLIDWLLEQKSQEDAEFQRQIEEYTAQGKSASIVEDESAKWEVYAISSNRKNQSFFNYYGPRKLVTQDKPGGGGEEPAPPAGVGKIVLKKTASGTTTGLAGARFSIYFNGQIVGSDITNAQGEIYVEDAATGLWSFVETSAPDGYCVDPTPKSVYVDVSEGDHEYTVAAVNYEKPDMKIIKRDAMSGKPIVGTVFSVKSVTGSYSTSVTTGTDGSATLSAIPAGVYVVREESVPEPYIVTNTEQTVALRPGKTSEVTFVDYEKPGLEIIKKNIANGEPIEGVTYRIEQIDGSYADLDFTRIYGSGQSAGSNTTQGFAMTNPEFYAAVATTSGAVTPKDPSKNQEGMMVTSTEPAYESIPTMMVTGQMDSGSMADGFEAKDMQSWANYMLQVNGFEVAYEANSASSVVNADSRHPEVYIWSKTVDGVEVPLVQWAQCLLRPHNCYPSDMPMLWDFMEHFSFEKAADGTVTRYYSPSAFEKDDAVALN